MGLRSRTGLATFSQAARKNRQRLYGGAQGHCCPMLGIDASTGKSLSGVNHLRQSVRDILTTPIGSRVMRRDYGSRLYQLVDAPMNDATRLDMMTATYEALEIWEPRLQLDSIAVEMPVPGNVVISLDGVYLPDGQEITLDGIEVR